MEWRPTWALHWYRLLAICLASLITATVCSLFVCHWDRRIDNVHSLGIMILVTVGYTARTVSQFAFDGELSLIRFVWHWSLTNLSIVFDHCSNGNWLWFAWTKSNQYSLIVIAFEPI